jgi:transglutaminase-like putative cysteine protease
MKLQTSTLCLGLLISLFAGLGRVQAQTQPAKFGKLDDAELTMRVYEQDTSAAAVVLSDVGYSYFTYNKGFKINFERHTRIKILKKSGYEAANVVVPYYQRNSKKENVYSIKGYTYNQEGDKVTKDKLEGKAVFDEQTSENWFAKKFTMPNVKEGSVIEYSYTITSDFLYNLREWEFQSTIPVAYSEYKVRIPEYFNYKQEQQGYLRFDVSTSERGKERFTVRWDAEITPGLGGGRTPGGSAEVDADNVTHRWVIKNAPALRPELYITTIRDYQSKIDFELQSVKYPGQLPQVMTGNWEQVVQDLMKEERFGSQLNRKGFFKNEVAAIAAKYTQPEQQMAAIYDLVKQTVKWNGKYGIYTTGSLRKAFENKAGSAAEVNLLLTAMLQEAGLDAAPVLVSTREHGRPPKGSPMLNKFNYVISHVVLGGKEYLLDATDPLLPAGMLPVRSLNGEGRLIKTSDSRWVSLAPAGMYTKLFSGELTINPNGSMLGKATESSSGYNALRLRKMILEEGEEKYAEKISKEIGNYKVEKPAFANIADLSKALNIEYKLSASGNGEAVDVIYLNPMLGQGEKENPFKLEDRVYPVDLAVPIDYTFVCRFSMPEGYDMEEAPQNAVVSLPENGGKFMYVVQKEGNIIQVMSKISILKPIYYAPEYPYLKEFYSQIVAKHAEQIVLKKVAAK